jgi:FKBP-type peptidyl-prolyl cis-trans isomerase (trigger factor)
MKTLKTLTALALALSLCLCTLAFVGCNSVETTIDPTANVTPDDFGTITADNIKIQIGDYANIDFTGYYGDPKNNIKFTGGTTDPADGGYQLGIGSNSFVPGFESGLVGAMLGEVVTLYLTFPNGYGELTLEDGTKVPGSNAQVTFVVVINQIIRIYSK